MERPRKFPRIFHFWWARWCQLPRLVLVMANLHTVPKIHRDSQHVQYRNVSFGVCPLLGLSWYFATDFLEFRDISDYVQVIKVITKLYQHRHLYMRQFLAESGNSLGTLWCFWSHEGLHLTESLGPVDPLVSFPSRGLPRVPGVPAWTRLLCFLLSEGNLFWRCWSGCFCTCFY